MAKAIKAKAKSGESKKVRFELMVFLYAVWVVLALWISNVLASPANAAGIQILDTSKLTAMGNCAIDDASVYSLSSGEQVLIASFQGYKVSASNTGMQRQRCMMALPFEGIAGKKLVIRRTAIYADKKHSVSGSISHEAFFTGGTGLSGRIDLGSLSDNLAYDRQLGSVESACGAAGILRLQNSVVVNSITNASQIGGEIEMVFESVRIALEDCI